MKSSELLADAFGRIDSTVREVLDGLDGTALNWRPDPAANSIAWLLWHLARIQDEQVAHVAGVDSRWRAGGFHERFGFDLDPHGTGYGHSAEQAAVVRVETAGLLLDYLGAVQTQSLDYVAGLDGADFDRIVDRRWTPAVTLGVRLVSVIDDCVQHAGQAAYVKGLFARAADR
ncbi:mycothiol transferase [Specibacter cremeus]|uniref:mycothiol transferase n=1 Tax=Specibacter cremeus TaxID=1629051 RepID=UPI000F78E66A|nr:DUF664 domain-containing protein [Specibacter cremeus]